MRQITGVAKARPVAAYVDMLLREHERVLLTGWHRDVYDIWLSKLWKYNPVLYTGTESKFAKDRNQQRFCTGDSRVMIISDRSRSEEHTSELQSLMRISYAVFCLKKKK